MALIKVNPTRMELIRLKRKLKTAQRGHKLLKEKRDGLMKEFMALVRTAKEKREEVEAKLSKGFQEFTLAGAMSNDNAVNEALMMPEKKTELLATTRNVMSVNIPEFEFKEQGSFLSYSLATTNSRLDTSLTMFNEVLHSLVQLSEKEHAAKLMAEEIEKTRRRVTALEYVFIPDMQETIKYITAKLNEQERAATITIMKIKEEMEARSNV